MLVYDVLHIDNAANVVAWRAHHRTTWFDEELSMSWVAGVADGPSNGAHVLIIGADIGRATTIEASTDVEQSKSSLNERMISAAKSASVRYTF